MPATDYPLTKADFDRCKWEEALETASKKDTFSYCIEFNKRLRNAKEAKDDLAEAVYIVLFVVTDVELRPDNPEEPLGP